MSIMEKAKAPPAPRGWRRARQLILFLKEKGSIKSLGSACAAGPAGGLLWQVRRSSNRCSSFRGCTHTQHASLWQKLPLSALKNLKYTKYSCLNRATGAHARLHSKRPLDGVWPAEAGPLGRCGIAFALPAAIFPRESASLAYWYSFIRFPHKGKRKSFIEKSSNMQVIPLFLNKVPSRGPSAAECPPALYQRT